MEAADMVYSSRSVCTRRGLRVCGDVAGHGGDGTAFGGAVWRVATDV